MAVAKIKHITITGYYSEKEKVLEYLQKKGIIQIINITESSPVEVSQKDYSKVIADFETASQILSKSEKPQGIFAELLKGKYLFSQKEFFSIIKSFNFYKKIANSIIVQNKKIDELNKKINELKDRYKIFSPWSKLSIKPKVVYSLTKIKALFLATEKENFAKLTDEIQNYEHEITIINQAFDKYYILIFYLDENILNTIKQVNPEIYDFSWLKTTVQNELKKIRNGLKKLEKVKNKIQAKQQEYKKYKPQILLLIDYFTNLANKEAIKSKIYSTEKAFILQGWINSTDLKLLKPLEKKFLDIDIRDPAIDENPPVMLSNPKIIKPFELITRLFGVPKYFELDPTILLMPFFALYFAICLTDAGYGIILILLSTIMLKILKIGPGGRQLLNLLLIAGCVTVIVGILTGGFFGINFDLLPESLKFLKEFRDRVLFFDPLKEPMKLFAIVLSLGIIQVFLGFLIKFLINIKNKNILSALFDQLPWLIIITGIVITVLTKNTYLLIISLITGIALILFFAGRESKTIFGRFAGGLLSLYMGVSGLFSDVLSYSRLLALALATSVIASVINTIAGLLAKIPVAGIVFMCGVLIAGHIFNMLINALSGFIHTTRLQFVEFFTKFYEGGGDEFSPFKEETKYTVVK